MADGGRVISVWVRYFIVHRGIILLYLQLLKIASNSFSSEEKTEHLRISISHAVMAASYSKNSHRKKIDRENMI